MQNGDRVQFVSCPALPAVTDSATFYYLQDSDKLYLGSQLIANNVKDVQNSETLGKLRIIQFDGSTREIDIPGNAFGIDCYKGKFPLDFTSPSGAIDEWKIYGNSSGPTEVLETQSTLPISIDTYGGNAVDWEIYGNNNPVIETESNTLPIDISSNGGNAIDYTIYGNDDNGTENLCELTIANCGIDGNGTLANSTAWQMICAPIVSGEKYTIISDNIVYGFYTSKPEVGSTAYNSTRYAPGGTTRTFTADINGWVAIRLESGRSDVTMLVKGSTAPDHYIPYQQGVGERTANILNFDDLKNAPSGKMAGATFTHMLELTVGEPNAWYTMAANGYGSMAGDYDTNRCIYFNNVGDNVVYDEHPITSRSDSEGKLKIGFASERANAQQYLDGTAQIWLVKGATVPQTYIPYGYQVSITVSQTGQTNKNYDIYIGDSPLTEGETVSKSSTGVDIELFSGNNIIDTSLYNKPNTSITYNSSLLGVGEAVWIYGLSAPLRAIGDVKDTLDLSTGTLTRRIKKLVLAGEESNWSTYSVQDGSYCAFLPIQNFMGSETSAVPAMLMCTHYTTSSQNNIYNGTFKTGCGGRTNQGLLIRDANITSESNFKSYLATQYAAGTPVTVWYVLDEPETSTIPVPSGLTDIIEGYLIQDGTPTPENPIYPTANGEEDTGETYKVFYSYQIPLLVTSGQQSTPHTIYIGSTPLTEGQSISKTSTGTELPLYQGENTISTTLGNKPVTRVDYESTEIGVGERTKNLFDVNNFIKGRLDNGVIGYSSGTTNLVVNDNSVSCTTGSNYRGIVTNNMISLSAGAYIFCIAGYNDALTSIGSKLAVYNMQGEYEAQTVHGITQWVNAGNYVYYTFTVNESKKVRISIEWTNTGNHTVSNVMLVKGSTLPSEYIPFGYQIPISIKQDDEVVDHKDIYIGTQPLIEGDYINQTGVYRRLQQFVNYVNSTALPEFNFIPITEQLIAGNGENTITTSLVNNTTIDVELHPTTHASWICDKLEELQRRIDNVDSTLGAPERRNYLVTWCSEARLTHTGTSSAPLTTEFTNSSESAKFASALTISGTSYATAEFTQTIDLLAMVTNYAHYYAGSSNYTVARPGDYVVIIYNTVCSEIAANQSILLQIVQNDNVVITQALTDEYVGCVPFKILNLDFSRTVTQVRLVVQSADAWTALNCQIDIAIVNASMVYQDSAALIDTNPRLSSMSLYDTVISANQQLQASLIDLTNRVEALERGGGGGGYNETQVDTVTDSVEEVTK